MNTLARNVLMAGGAGLAAFMTLRTVARWTRWFSFRDRTVLVTGGSRGLGLVLARMLVDAGARVAICARTEPDVREAGHELRRRGGRVLALPCDVGDQDQVNALVQEVRRQFGPIEVVFNVAGIIQVGPLEEMTREDFEQAMATHFWGPLHTTLAVLPEMRRRQWGRIVNVSSIGGKQAVPHLIPYCASKHALVGLSNGLRTELARDGIYVTTICPSLMRTGSPRNALFKGHHRAEYTWFSLGGAMPLASMPAEQAARQILDACQAGDGEVIVTNYLNPGIWLQRMFPQWTTEVLSLLNRFLPGPGGIGQRAARGYESETALSPSFLTALNEAAARRNNEMRPHPV